MEYIIVSKYISCESNPHWKTYSTNLKFQIKDLLSPLPEKCLKK